MSDVELPSSKHWEVATTLSENTESPTVKAVYEMYVRSLRDKEGQENEKDKDGPKKELSNQVWRFVKELGTEPERRIERKMSDIKGREVEEYVKRSYAGPQSAEPLQAVKDFLKYADKQKFTRRTEDASLENDDAMNPDKKKFTRRDPKGKHTLANHLRIPRPKSQAKSTYARDGQAANVIELTPEGHQNLVGELEDLKAQRGPIAEQIRKAAADKDVRENAPLEAAREHQGQVEARIREIENTLEIVEIVDPSARKKAVVQMGSRVLLRDLEPKDKVQYYDITIVSALEARPLEKKNEDTMEGKMSDTSPLGEAVIGEREGEKIPFTKPRGDQTTYSILKVS